MVGEGYEETRFFSPKLARYYGAHASWPRVPVYVDPNADNSSHGHCLVPVMQFNIEKLKCKEFVEIIGKPITFLAGSQADIKIT